MTLAHWLERTAQAHPTMPAVALGARTYQNYGQLAAAAAALGGWLKAAQCAAGARVVIVSENRAEYLELLFGVWWIGAVATPLDAEMGSAALAARIADAEAQICFVSPKAAVKVAERLPDCVSRLIVIDGPDYRRALAHEPVAIGRQSRISAAWLSYYDDETPLARSGGEGRPLGAVISHYALMNLALAYLAEIDVTTPRDAVLHATPFGDGSGMYALPAIARGGVNVIPETGGFDPAEIFELSAAWRRVSTLVTAGAARDMARSDADCDQSAFRSIVIGGDDVLAADKREALERFGPRLIQVYGKREFPLTISRLSKHDIAGRGDPHWRTKLSSVGRGFLMVQVDVRGPDGRSAPNGSTGEVLVQGPVAMLGYWRAPAATAGAYIDGWLRTGDVGRIDAHGYLTIEGAAADVLPSERGPLFPRRVEEALRAHPLVSDAAFVTRSAKTGRAFGVAYVVGDASRDALERYCRDRLPPAYRPDEFVAVKALPRRRDGAIARDALEATAGKSDAIGVLDVVKRAPR